MKIVAIVAATLVIWGALGVASGLIMAFGAVGGEAIDPSQKARILAEGISRVMTSLVQALVVGIPSAIALLVVLKKRKAE
jgi:hypothetical protein